eukprot:9095613-Heterocapsa_arctica.AAC.1
MVVYAVYKATFLTKKGSRRHYVGMSVNPEQRKRSLQKAGPYQPAWLKAGCEQLYLVSLVTSVPSKGVALAIGALAFAQ